MNFRKYAYVLLSGGIDSTTCLYMAMNERDMGVMAISIDYGQRHKKELEHADKICSYVGVAHHTINLKGIIPRTMLTDKHSEIPDASYADIKGVSPAYVPFRNGLILSAVTSLASGAYENMKEAFDYHGKSNREGPEWRIYFGAHAEDAANWAYPDCTPEFIGAMANAIHVGTDGAVRLYTPLEWLTKADIIRLGEERYGVKWDMTWSCYAGGSVHCGTCPTCRARKEGFKSAGVEDPTEYAA